MNKILYVLMCSSVMLFSCERKADDSTGKISVTVPANQNSSLQEILNPLSVVTSMSSNENGFEEFNPYIMPSFSIPALWPVNCYLIAVGSESSESTFSQNFCGKRSTVTGKIDAEYKFGPYVGLKPSGSEIEIEVPAGDKRKVFVFAIHALNAAACKTLTAEKGQNPSKENFSRPYLVGTSATFSVRSGQTALVPINMNQPVAANSIEDCVFRTLNSEVENLANRIALERPNFPYNVMGAGLSTDINPTNYRCDYIDLVPKYEYLENGVPQFKPAFLSGLKAVIFQLDSIAHATFATKYACEQNTGGGVYTFEMNPTHKSVRRWIPLHFALDGSYHNLSAVVSNDANITTLGTTGMYFKSVRSDASSDLSNGAQPVKTKLDIVIPKRVRSGECYPFFITRKSLEDEPVTHPSTDQVIALASAPATSSFTVYDDSACGNVHSGNFTIFNNAWYSQYYFKAAQNFSMSVSEFVTTFTDSTMTSATINIDVKNSISQQIESVELTAPTLVRRRSSPYNCYPFTFRFNNEDRVNVKSNVAGANIEILHSQFQGDFTSIDFYEDEPCSTTSLSAAAGVPHAQFLLNDYFKKVYLRVNASAQLGNKTARFKIFDGIKYHYLKHDFEVEVANTPP